MRTHGGLSSTAGVARIGVGESPSPTWFCPQPEFCYQMDAGTTVAEDALSRMIRRVDTSRNVGADLQESNIGLLEGKTFDEIEPRRRWGSQRLTAPENCISVPIHWN
jgi:hypothetical protein